MPKSHRRAHTMSMLQGLPAFLAHSEGGGDVGAGQDDSREARGVVVNTPVASSLSRSKPPKTHWQDISAVFRPRLCRQYCWRFLAWSAPMRHTSRAFMIFNAVCRVAWIEKKALKEGGNAAAGEGVDNIMVCRVGSAHIDQDGALLFVDDLRRRGQVLLKSHRQYRDSEIDQWRGLSPGHPTSGRQPPGLAVARPRLASSRTLQRPAQSTPSPGPAPASRRSVSRPARIPRRLHRPLRVGHGSAGAQCHIATS